MSDEKTEKTNLVKRVQEMSVCYFSKSIIGLYGINLGHIRRWC